MLTSGQSFQGSSNFKKLDGNEALILGELFDINTNGIISNLHESSKNDLNNHISQSETDILNITSLNTRSDLNCSSVLQTYNTIIWYEERI